MNDAQQQRDAFRQRLLWLAAVLVGAVYFFVAHDFNVSRYERFAPWSDAGGEIQAAGQNVAKGAALGLLGLFGAYLLMRPDGRPLRPTGALPAVIALYLLWATASVAWSIDPGMSARRLAVLTFCALAALGFARQFQPRDLAWMALLIAGAYLVVGIASEMALGTFRPWTPGYRFAGTVHPNTQGGHLTCLCLAAFCLARSTTQGRAWLWAAFAAGLAFLVLTKSRTACGALVLALAAIWFASASARARTLAALSAAWLISGALLAGALWDIDVDDAAMRAVMLGRQEESEALTGRLPIWNSLLGYIQARPLQGYGYESFWTTRNIETASDALGWPLREAHNAAIDALLSVGAVGLGLFLAAVLLALIRAAAAYRRTRDLGFDFVLGMLVFGMANACLESGMMSPGVLTLIAGSGVVYLAFSPSAELQTVRRRRNLGQFSSTPLSASP